MVIRREEVLGVEKERRIIITLRFDTPCMSFFTLSFDNECDNLCTILNPLLLCEGAVMKVTWKYVSCF